MSRLSFSLPAKCSPVYSPFSSPLVCPTFAHSVAVQQRAPAQQPAQQPVSSCTTDPFPLQFTFDNPLTGSTRPSPNTPSALPILLFVCGLGGDPLPPCQASRLRSRFNIISLGLKPNDASTWPVIIAAACATANTLRQNSPTPIVVVSESFGSAFAFRLIEACPKGTFERHVMINPATAFHQDSILLSISSLLPLLRLDPTNRLLYNGAALFMFRYVLTDASRLAPSSFQNAPYPPSIDTNRIPLSSLLHRIALLSDHNAIPDHSFMHSSSEVPATLVASARDRLLQSPREVERLSQLLPNIRGKLILPQSAHAPLCESHVDLRQIIDYANGMEPLTGGNLLDDSRWTEVRHEAAVDLAKTFYARWETLVRPVFLGNSHVFNALHMCTNNRPVLFVGIHSRCGIFDTSLICMQLQRLLNGRKLRPVADRLHFETYGDISGGRWSDFVKDIGAVPATPRHLVKLLKGNEAILLFPGGAKDVCRRRGEKYTFEWDEKANFVRLAAKYDGVIVPFCTVGADDAVDIIADGQELQKLPFVGNQLRKWLQENNMSTENVMPLTSFPPRLDRFYFKFFKPVDTANLDATDKAACARSFRHIKRTVGGGIDELRAYREKDHLRRFSTRVLQRSGLATAAQLQKVIDYLSPF